MAQAIPETTPVNTSSDWSSLDHFYCEHCYPKPEFCISLCGVDLSDGEETLEGAEDRCVVCLDLDNHPCEYCGQF